MQLISAKTCSKCAQEKSISHYRKDAQKIDGLYSSCKSCVANYMRLYRVGAKEGITKYNIEWVKKNKQKAADATRRYKLAHPERLRERKNKWRKTNLEKARASAQRWRDKNREKVRLMVRMANAKRRSNGLRNPIRVVNMLLVLQKNKCAICRVDIAKSFHIDHVMPLKLGGDNLPNNLQLLCPSCNGHKKDKHPVDFMQSRGFLL